MTLLVAQAGVFYARITSTTEKSPQSALAEFRAGRVSVTHSSPLKPAIRSPARTGLAAHRSRPAPLHRARLAPTASSKTRRAGATLQCDWACVTVFAPPREGVYEWLQCGRASGSCTGDGSGPQATERIGAIRRPLPRVGQRILTATGPASWTFTHYRAEERRDLVEVSIDRAGVYVHRWRSELSLAGLTKVVDVRMEPPAKVTALPARLGRSWRGRWKDPNGEADGEYTVAIIGRETVLVSGTPIRTWVVEEKEHLLGPKTHGFMLVRMWLSPALRQSVQEYYEQDIVKDGISYETKIMMTLASVRPRR